MSEENQGQQTEGTAPTAPEAPKLSRRETLLAKYNSLFAKRAEIDKKLGEIVGEVNAIDKLGSLAAGSVVEFTVGRGEEATSVVGTVVAIRANEDGTKDFKVTYGTGFDANVAVVPEAKIRVPAEAALPPNNPARA